jgi:hypothetical protein
MKIDGLKHESPLTPDAGLHSWFEVVGDVRDVDGHQITYGVHAFAVDDWYWR